MTIAKTDSADRPTPLSWRRRVLLFLLAVGATAAYAGSFFVPEEARAAMARVASVVAVGAALSWPVFGAILLASTAGKSRGILLRWADTCLRTMARGNAVLGVSILLNGVYAFMDTGMGRTFAVAHLTILLAANLTMAWFFVTGTRATGLLTAGRATFAWIAGLNLPFILIVLLLWNFT